MPHRELWMVELCLACLRGCLLCLQMLSAPLFCLLAATAEAAEARQVVSALRAAPPQLVVCSSSGARRPAASAPAGLSSSQHASTPAGSSSEAGAVEAAVATSVAAFSPQLSVPLTLGLQYTNSGVLTAVSVFWVAVLWPR